VAEDLTIRRIRADDGRAWQRLFASVAEEGLWIGAEPPVPDRSQEVVDQYVDSETDVMYIAFVDDEPVGWISGETEKDGRVEIGMGIVDGFRSRGIGSALMEAVIAWAAERTIVLRVFPHNDRAIALYRKFGFVTREQQVGVWPRRNGDFWDLLFMERQPAAG
jgi:ribosomal protein S18 acetylase RimI-like enzyme